MKTINAEEEMMFGGYDGLESRYYIALGSGILGIVMCIVLTAIASCSFYSLFAFGMNYIFLGIGIISTIFLPYASYKAATFFMDAGKLKVPLERKRSKVNYNK